LGIISFWLSKLIVINKVSNLAALAVFHADMDLIMDNGFEHLTCDIIEKCMLKIGKDFL
jgi:hypothetical protein